ncbi:MAG: DUF1566 domain-containing protein [Nitrospirae bacterium]|nr:DUF1566 domain-containing protein [Nitrospirota bacterium]
MFGKFATKQFLRIAVILSFTALLLTASGVTSLFAGTVSLPQTGQTTSYYAGDDGALQKGVAWPNPRFTVNADQTVNDNLTGLVWAKDAGTPTVSSCTGGVMTWQAALDYVACLNTANYLGYNDWRLPNINELESITSANYPSKLNSQGFANVQYNYYWSSTTLASNTSIIWDGKFSNGGLGVYGKSGPIYVWPVRSGQSEAFGNSAIWQTGQITTYAAGDDGTLQKGVAWPNPRFTNNGNQTATDNLTGLIWTKNAGTPTLGSCTGSPMIWQAALDYVACLNTANYLGYSDWRLPNKKELRSIADYATYNPALTPGHPFANVQPSYYWSSTTDSNYS